MDSLFFSSVRVIDILCFKYTVNSTFFILDTDFPYVELELCWLESHGVW